MFLISSKKNARPNLRGLKERGKFHNEPLLYEPAIPISLTWPASVLVLPIEGIVHGAKRPDVSSNKRRQP